MATESLKAQYDRLHAERVASWPPAQLATNIGQRQALVDAFDPAAVAQPGDAIAPIDLLDGEGRALPLASLVKDGPAVLIFFRFAGCPACNIALPYYDRTLAPALAKAGVKLIAVSPQIPGRVGEIAIRHGLSFPVATDPDNGLARALGVAFQPADRPAPPPAGWIGEVTGTNSWELPQPTIAILDKGLILRTLIVSPDWLDRPEAAEILAHIPEVEARAAA
jgi:peroxiredoxin